MRAPTEVETEDRAVRALTSRLAARYADQYPAAHVAEVIAAARKRFLGAPVRGYVLIFIERAARWATAEGVMIEVSSLRRPPNFPQDWRLRSACRGRDLTQFYPGENEPRSRVRLKEAQAKAMCNRCPVRPECAALALATHERHGIWGGFTTQERMRLLALGWEDLASTARTSVDALGLERRLQTKSGRRRSGSRRTAG